MSPDQITALREQFASHQRLSKRGRYSHHFKQLVRDAKQRGFSVDEISTACGLGQATIYAWLAKVKKPNLRTHAIRELTLVDAQPDRKAPITITLPSGIRIEVR